MDLSLSPSLPPVSHPSLSSDPSLIKRPHIFPSLTEMRGGGEAGGEVRRGGEKRSSPLVISGNQDLTWEENWEMGREGGKERKRKVFEIDGVCCGGSREAESRWMGGGCEGQRRKEGKRKRRDLCITL